MEQTERESASPPPKTGALVLKNTLVITLARALGMPLSILLNAMLARYLGPAEVGHIYFATTITTFGLLVIEWGRLITLPGAVARDRAQAGALLGSSIGWSVMTAPFVYVVLAVGCRLFGYQTDVQWALGLVFLTLLLSSLGSACQDAIRGFERADIGAYGYVGQQLMMTLLVIPVLTLGGGTRGALLAQACAVVVVLLLVQRALRPVGVGALKFQRSALKSLLVAGAPFVLINLAQVVQPNIDALYLSKLAPSEVMGWYAVSRRLIGVLLFPVSSLVGSLYPTLCRLQSTNDAEFRRMAGVSLWGVALMAVPISLGCALYPEIGITIFNRESFGPAEDNLRVLALYLFLVYFSMPLSSCVIAAGRGRMWTVVQVLSCVISAVLDPLFVPWFQAHGNNGGVGLCWVGVLTEIMIVAWGIVITPKGIFTRSFARAMLGAALAGGVMAGVAYALRPVTPFVAAPLAVLAYGVALVLTGGVGKERWELIKRAVGQGLMRRRGRGS